MCVCVWGRTMWSIVWLFKWNPFISDVNWTRSARRTRWESCQSRLLRSWPLQHWAAGPDWWPWYWNNGSTYCLRKTDRQRDKHAINWTCLDMLFLLLLPSRDFSISAICLTFVRSLRSVAMSIAFALTIATIVYAGCHVAYAATCGRHCCQPTYVRVQCDYVQFRTFIPATHRVEKSYKFVWTKISNNSQKQARRPLKEYIFLISMTRQVDKAISVCVNRQISVIVKARGTKFGIRAYVYQHLMQFILNIMCHAHCPRISMM